MTVCAEGTGLPGYQTAVVSALGKEPADTARGPALLVSSCCLCKSQCHNVWNGIILNLASPPKDAIPVLCIEAFGGHSPT